MIRKSCSKLTALCEGVKHDLGCAISGLPRFECHWLSDLPRKFRNDFKPHWIAIASIQGELRDWLEVQHGPHNPIVLSEKWLVNAPSAEWVEVVVLHEVAHYMADDIDRSAPAHGLLWGRCYTALACLLGLDQVELFEAVDHILDCSRQELRCQLQLDGCETYSQWAQRMYLEQRQISNRLDLREEEIPEYEDLLALCNLPREIVLSEW